MKTVNTADMTNVTSIANAKFVCIRSDVGILPAMKCVERPEIKWLGDLVRVNPTSPAARAYNRKT